MMTVLMVTKSPIFPFSHATYFLTQEPAYLVIFNTINYRPLHGLSAPYESQAFPGVNQLDPVQFCHPYFYHMN